MKRRKTKELELTIDDRKKALYSSYLDYTLVTMSSVYDYYAKVPHSKDKEWQELKEMQKAKTMKKQQEQSE